MIIFRRKIGFYPFKGLGIVDLFPWPGEKVYKLYLSLLVDENILWSHISNKIPGIILDVLVEIIFNREVTKQQIPQLSLAKRDVFRLSDLYLFA